VRRAVVRLLLALGAAAVADAQPARGPVVAVSDEVGHDVRLIDAGTGATLATIPTGARARGVRASRDGKRVYVALSDDAVNAQTGADAIAVVDVATRRIVARVPAGSDPEQFAVTSDDRWLVASNEDAGTASVVSLGDGKVAATLVVGIEPEGVVVSPDDHWALVTAETSNSVSIVDLRAHAVVGAVLVDPRPRAAAFAPDGTRAYVSAEIGGTLSEIDVRRRAVVRSVPLEGGTGKPVGVAAAGGRVWVANGAADVVSVLDARTLRAVGRVRVGRRPWGIAASADGRWVVTANGLSDNISIIDARTLAVVRTIPVGKRPWGVAIVP